MREMKFRLWDGKELRAIDLYWFEENGVRAVPGDLPEGYALMQFTGLKDKHGNEIYEGDIVFDHPHQLKLIVKWCDGQHGYLGSPVGWHLNNGYYSLEFTGFLSISDEQGTEPYADVDVLGNRYEHEALLKTLGSFGYDPITEEQEEAPPCE